MTSDLHGAYMCVLRSERVPVRKLSPRNQLCDVIKGTASQILILPTDLFLTSYKHPKLNIIHNKSKYRDVVVVVLFF